MTDPSPTDHAEQGFAWRESGDGPCVVFLHGLGLTRTGWEPQLTGLSDARRCVAWDMPGYGESTPLPELTFESITDALARFLDVIREARSDLVGLSFGGMHAGVAAAASAADGWSPVAAPDAGSRLAGAAVVALRPAAGRVAATAVPCA